MVVPTIMRPDVALPPDPGRVQETAEVPTMATVLGLQVEAAPSPTSPVETGQPPVSTATPQAGVHTPRPGGLGARVALAVVLTVLTLPTVILIVRSVFGAVMNPAGVAGGLLLLAGLALLAAGAGPLVLARAAADPRHGRHAEAILPGTTLLVATGVVLLLCAAIAVS
jgi:hypothetical protein